MTREDFGLWKEHPVTEALFAQLKEDLKRLQEALLYASPEDVSKLQGQAQAVVDVLNIEYQDIAQDD